jgi:hypothetical protein
LTTDEQASLQPRQRDSIYAVESGGRVKVGFSRYPAQRTREVLRAAGGGRVIAVADGSIASERAVHAKLHAERDDGEWFVATPEEVIDAMKDAGLDVEVISKSAVMNTANIGRTPAPPPPRPVTPIQPAPRLEVVEEPEPEAPPPVVIRFDHDAAATREKAMNAIAALASQPAPEAVIDAWMKHTGYGVEVATIERAIAWLTAFLPLYADAEPKRWATIQEKIRNVA